MKKKITSVLALALAAASLLSACGGSGTSEKPADSTASAAVSEDKDTVIYAFPYDPQTFTPLRTQVSGQSDVACMIYDTLWQYVNGEFQWQVATGFDEVDPVTYNVHLREDVFFSDGHQLVAQDVLDSIRFYYEDKSSQNRVSSIDMEKTNVIDDFTIQIVLAQENPFQMCNLGSVNLVYKEAYENSGDKFASSPIGSGPYVLKEYVPNAYLVLEGREDYWRGMPPAKTLKIMFVPEASQRVTMLKTGEADFTINVLPMDYEDLTQNGFQGYQVATDRSNGAYFNCDPSSLTNDVRVRQAAAYALDNAGILTAVYGGFGDVCETIASSGVYDLDDLYIPDDYYTYSIEKGKALLEEAGVEKGTPFVVIYKSGDESGKSSAQIVQASLDEMGFSTELRAIESASWTDTLRDHSSGWNMAFNTMNTTGSYSALDIMNLYVFTIPELGYTNEEGKALCTKTVNSTDPDIISEGTYELSKLVYEEVPYYSITSAVTLFVSNDSVNLNLEKTNVRAFDIEIAG